MKKVPEETQVKDFKDTKLACGETQRHLEVCLGSVLRGKGHPKWAQSGERLVLGRSKRNHPIENPPERDFGTGIRSRMGLQDLGHSLHRASLLIFHHCDNISDKLT